MDFIWQVLSSVDYLINRKRRKINSKYKGWSKYCNIMESRFQFEPFTCEDNIFLALKENLLDDKDFGFLESLLEKYERINKQLMVVKKSRSKEVYKFTKKEMKADLRAEFVANLMHLHEISNDKLKKLYSEISEEIRLS